MGDSLLEDFFPVLVEIDGDLVWGCSSGGNEKWLDLRYSLVVEK